MAVVGIKTTPTRQTQAFHPLFQALGSSFLVCPCSLLGLCLVVHSLALLLPSTSRSINNLQHWEPFHFDPLVFSYFFFSINVLSLIPSFCTQSGLSCTLDERRTYSLALDHFLWLIPWILVSHMLVGRIAEKHF